MPKFVLNAFPGGRSEAARICLTAAGVEWEEVTYNYPKYQEKKASKSDEPVWANGLPVLEVDGKPMTQSLAITRYAAKLAGLYPEDPMQALACDEIMDIWQDVLSKTPKGASDDETKSLREAYAAGKMHSMMCVLSERLEASGSGFIAGPKLTVADLLLYALFHMLRTGNFTYVPGDYLDKWPNLVSLEKSVPEQPVVKAFYEKYPPSS